MKFFLIWAKTSAGILIFKQNQVGDFKAFETISAETRAQGPEEVKKSLLLNIAVQFSEENFFTTEKKLRWRYLT